MNNELALQNNAIAKINDNVIAIKRCKLWLYGETEPTIISYREYEMIDKAITEDVRHIKLLDGTIISVGKIQKLKPITMTELIQPKVEDFYYEGAWEEQPEEERQKVKDIMASIKSSASWYKPKGER